MKRPPFLSRSIRNQFADHRHRLGQVGIAEDTDLGNRGGQTACRPSNQCGTLDAQASQLKAAIWDSPCSIAKIDLDEPL